jgi:signal transduction histidine kinase/CheY-like chemotaxis protein
MHDDTRARSLNELFQADRLDLQGEIMTRGVLVPLMILGYAGLVLSYQKPFLANLDFRTPSLFTLTFALGITSALVRQQYPRVAMWVTSCGALILAHLFYITGLDGHTAIGVSIACGIVTLLLGPLAGWVAVLVSGVALAMGALDSAAPGLWPMRVAGPTLAAAFATILAQVMTRVLFRALRWTQENYELARKQADELADKSAQLELALRSLSQSSFNLARANEQMEVAMQYAEEARQSKQQFAAAVSHELRAPLNLIIGFSDLILNEPVNYLGIASVLPPRLLADIHVINNHAQHLLKLVNDILDLSQLDVNYLTISRAPTQVSDIINAAVNDYTELANHRGLRLNVDIAPNLPPVTADPMRIRQVLLNLFSNALRVTVRGGITVRACAQTTDDGPQTANPAAAPVARLPSSVVISVADTGTGIAPDDYQRIFEPFVQVGDFTQRRNAGSGLGLTISKRFVELHGGTMWVESELGAGSTFFFTLPVDAGEAASAPERSQHEFKRREVGALTVVERNPVLSRLMERHLDGIRVASVATLSELAEPDAEAPEVVLINEPAGSALTPLDLPGTLSRIPVFRCYVHGALALPAVDGESSEIHTHFYLIKPIKREQLYAALATMLAGHDATAERRPARVLVVEDEDDASYMLGRMLRLAPSEALPGFDGVTVVKARSGEQAMDILKDAGHPDADLIDVVLLDLVLGGISGYSILAEMERREELRDIPVCVITGQVASGDLLVTPYLEFSRKNGLSSRELAEAVAALTRIALPGVEVTAR